MELIGGATAGRHRTLALMSSGDRGKNRHRVLSVDMVRINWGRLELRIRPVAAARHEWTYGRINQLKIQLLMVVLVVIVYYGLVHWPFKFLGPASPPPPQILIIVSSHFSKHPCSLLR